jgi:hypothetical protein
MIVGKAAETSGGYAAAGPTSDLSATDPDFRACEKSSGDDGIAARDRAIASGKFTGRSLSYLYSDRGFVRMQKARSTEPLPISTRPDRLHQSLCFLEPGRRLCRQRRFRQGADGVHKVLALNPDTTSKARIEEALNAVTGANAPQLQAADPSVISDPSAFGEHDQGGSASASSSYPADAMPASPSIDAEPALPAEAPPGQ